MIRLLLLALALTGSLALSAQEWGFGAKGGLLIGTHANKRPLPSYQGSVFVERAGPWQAEGTRRLGFVAQLGYHRRGASYTAGTFNSANFVAANDVFHNLSLAVLLKGGYRAKNLIPYYAGGLRVDVTVANEVVNPFEAQGVRPLNAGLWLGGGLEWTPPNLPFNFFIELNICPDITPQVFFLQGTQVQFVDPFRQTSQVRTMTEDYRVTNICLEVSVGIKFVGNRAEDELPLEE